MQQDQVPQCQERQILAMFVFWESKANIIELFTVADFCSVAISSVSSANPTLNFLLQEQLSHINLSLINLTNFQLTM